MRIIGLTGGIASGKSTVARMLVEKGAYIIDADKLAREVVEPGREAWQEIVDWLGKDILQAGGSIDREKLAEIVFNDRKMLKKLNSIVHPQVGKQLLARTAEIGEKNPDAIIVYDVPLLIEAKMADMVDIVLLVYVPPEIQIERQQKRDGISCPAAEARLKAQMPLDDKRKMAHLVIDNSGTIAATAEEVERIWPLLSGKIDANRSYDRQGGN